MAFQAKNSMLLPTQLTSSKITLYYTVSLIPPITLKSNQ